MAQNYIQGVEDMKRSTLKNRLVALALGAACLAVAPVFAQEAVKPLPPIALPDAGPVEIAPRDSGLPADWDRGVFVEILVRAYQDSNGDGIGDLNGLTARLDYLKELGVSGIWLMPVFKSADHDHGYAVANYREIEPQYGTLADFDRLIAEAHKRGIGIIVDYVMNHSSADHPAFENAYDRPRTSRYKDWYIFSNKEMPGWNTFSGDPWREGGPNRWYYAVFDAAMPDFNLRNPEVVDFHMNNLKFWLNHGVDGFRFDAVGVLIENSAIAWENQPENHQLMKKVQDLLAQYGKRYMVCEAPSDPGAFAAEDSCGSAFAFGIQKHIIKSIKMGRVMPDMLYNLRTLPVARMGTILANHDYFAGARLFDQFRGDLAGYRLAAASLLTLPGRPFIYYGEEIGLSHAEPVAYDDQSIRAPMSWSSAPQTGFTTSGEPFRPNAANWQQFNVEAERGKPDSLLSWYERLIALRQGQPALKLGDFKALSKNDDPIFAFEREYQGSKVLVLINYAYREGRIDLPPDFKAADWQALLPAGAALDVSIKSAPPPAKKAKGKTLGTQEAAFVPGTQELKMPPQSVMIFKAAN